VFPITARIKLAASFFHFIFGAVSVQGCQMVYFQTENRYFGYCLECLGIKKFGIFCGHSEYFTSIWYVTWPFGIFCVHFGVFFPIRFVAPRKIWQPWPAVGEIQNIISRPNGRGRPEG
jgi:hypothetical protein